MFAGSISGSGRPLPLKQRTSSLDTRRDYSHSTWWSLLGLLKAREYFVTVDNFSIWRRHLAWAMENGKDLRAYMTQRYGSSMVFMSLLLSTELSVLLNSSTVTTKVRETLLEGNHRSISFWAGFLILISALLTVTSLIALFTAWGMVNSIDEVNMHCIFRSSIGQYAAELPGRLIVCSIYTFLSSFVMFFFLLLPVGPWSITLFLLAFSLFIHIVSTFSAFGRVIMHTGAMGSARIFSPEDEECLLPRTLHSNLLAKAQANLANNASIIRQYRRDQHRHSPAGDTMDESSIRYYDHDSSGHDNDASELITESSSMAHYRSRADSTVRFADMEEANGKGKSSHHYHTLTPLSDSSSFQSNELPHDLDINGPVTVVGQSSLKRSSYGGGPRTLRGQQQQPDPLPPLPPPGVYSKEISSSSSSIDQWLQNSAVSAGTSTPPPELLRDDRGKDMDSLPSYPVGDFKSQEQEAYYSSSSVANSFVANFSPGSRSAIGPTINLSTPAKSSAGRNQTTPSRSELSFDNRHLSEDERFALDYGDFHPTRNLEATSSPLRQFDDLADVYADNHQAEHNGGTERQRLIRATTPTNRYDSGRNSNAERL